MSSAYASVSTFFSGQEFNRIVVFIAAVAAQAAW
jgi:hypothetical protein